MTVIIGCGNIALIERNNTLVIKVTVKNIATFDVIFFTLRAKLNRLFFKRHHFCFNEADAVVGRNAYSSVGRDNNTRCVRTRKPTLVAVVGELAVVLMNQSRSCCKVFVAVLGDRHIGDMSLGKSCNLGMIEPVAVVVIDAYALVRANPDVADGIHIKAGDGVAERAGNAVHKLRPVPAFTCEGVKSAAVCSDIYLVVLIYGKTASFAGNADLDLIASLAVELVENGFCQYPRFTVKIDLYVDEL